MDPIRQLASVVVALSVVAGTASCTAGANRYPATVLTTSAAPQLARPRSGITGRTVARGGPPPGINDVPVSEDVAVTPEASDTPLVTAHPDADGVWTVTVPPGRYEVSADIGGNVASQFVNVDPNSYSSVILVFELL